MGSSSLPERFMLALAQEMTGIAVGPWDLPGLVPAQTDCIRAALVDHWARSRRCSRSLSSIWWARYVRSLREVEVLDFLGEAKPVGTTEGYVVPSTVGHQGAELEGVVRDSPTPLSDRVKPASRIGPGRGVVEYATELFQEEQEVGGHQGVASYCGDCPIQGPVSQGGHDESDPGPIGPESGGLMAE